MTIREILEGARRRLHRAGSASPRLDAEVLLAHGLGIPRGRLLAGEDREVPAGVAAWLEWAVRERARGCPVAYLTGRREFFSLGFRVGPGVLIPRPETEHLVEEALEIAAGIPRGRIDAVDVGTGSGVIAVTLAVREPRARVLATDLSGAALRVARRNARAFGVGERVRFLRADLLAPIGGAAACRRFDMVLANPPYVTDSEYARLPAGIRRFEPEGALRAGPDPFHFHRRIAAASWPCLREGGWVALEIGGSAPPDPGAVRGILPGYRDIRIRRDYAGIPRVLIARKGDLPGSS